MNDNVKLDVWSHIETIEPQNRLVLLGASNLTRAFPTVVGMALNTLDGPLSISAAIGLGRSFGKESSFLGKKISGIFQCGIWQNLERQKGIPTTAFVTDIGNDLAYEEPVERVVEWVDGCLQRLHDIDARIVLTDLPMEVLRTVGASRYRIFRTVLFPNCRLDWREMLCRADRLSEQLHQLAEKRKVPIFIGKKEWYGWDPIHPRRPSLRPMWRELMETNGIVSRESPAIEKSLSLAWYLRNLRPEKWSTFSISRRASQPYGRLVDGTEIALF